jgi:hypothetical protein
MASLLEQLGSGNKRQIVVEDALQVLDQEVQDKGGLTGLAIKGAYKLVQGVRPGFLRHVVENLLDDFLTALEPMYTTAREQKQPAGAYFRTRPGDVADALLAVTDRKARNAESATIKGAYEKLRPMGRVNLPT